MANGVTMNEIELVDVSIDKPHPAASLDAYVLESAGSAGRDRGAARGGGSVIYTT